MQILGTWDNNKQGNFADGEERGKINFSENGNQIHCWQCKDTKSELN